MVKHQELMQISSSGIAGEARILVVEDEAILAEMTRRLLVRWGYEVIAVLSSGEAAVEEARRLCPDLILMDVRLSGRLDGFEAARRITVERPVPVIFTTGYNDDDATAQAAMACPVSVALSKPIPPPQLQETVAEMLQRTMPGDGGEL